MQDRSGIIPDRRVNSELADRIAAAAIAEYERTLLHGNVVAAICRVLAEHDAKRAEAERELVEAAEDFLSGIDTCHVCGAALMLLEGPAYCSDCSSDCQDHDEPECGELRPKHQRLRAALAAYREVQK